MRKKACPGDLGWNQDELDNQKINCPWCETKSGRRPGSCAMRRRSIPNIEQPLRDSLNGLFVSRLYLFTGATSNLTNLQVVLFASDGDWGICCDVSGPQSPMHQQAKHI